MFFYLTLCSFIPRNQWQGGWIWLNQSSHQLQWTCLTSFSDHLRAAHNLLDFVPTYKYWLDERTNQPDWLGPTKRPKKFEDRQKFRVRAPKPPRIPTRIVIREADNKPLVVGPPSEVVLTGAYKFRVEPVQTSLVERKDNGVYVRSESKLPNTYWPRDTRVAQ